MLLVDALRPGKKQGLIAFLLLYICTQVTRKLYLGLTFERSFLWHLVAKS
jgi:hypothetical protein